MTDHYGRLTLFCRNHAGESLRGVFRYTADRCAVEFVRPDLEATYDEQTRERLAAIAWDFHEGVLREGRDAGSFGECRSVVYAFEDAFVLQVSGGSAEGALVAFDRQTGDSLLRILRECETFFA